MKHLQKRSKSGLVGTYHVRPTRTVWKKARRLFQRKAKPFGRLHTEVVQLRDFGNPDAVAFLDVESVKALSDHDIYEQRINRTLGGRDNLRVIFWKPGHKREGDPLPIIWIIDIFQKTNNAWTSTELQAMKAKKMWIHQIYYVDKEF